MTLVRATARFGLGWRLSVPAITRKTDKGLPRYNNNNESDTFILSNAEDLVPALVQSGASWNPDSTQATLNGERYTVSLYRPRGRSHFCED